MASLTEKFCEQKNIDMANLGLLALNDQVNAITSTLGEIKNASAHAAQGAKTLGNSVIERAASFLQQPMPEVNKEFNNNLDTAMNMADSARTTPTMGPGN